MREVDRSEAEPRHAGIELEMDNCVFLVFAERVETEEVGDAKVVREFFSNLIVFGVSVAHDQDGEYKFIFGELVGFVERVNADKGDARERARDDRSSLDQAMSVGIGLNDWSD